MWTLFGSPRGKHFTKSGYICEHNSGNTLVLHLPCDLWSDEDVGSTTWKWARYVQNTILIIIRLAAVFRSVWVSWHVNVEIIGIKEQHCGNIFVHTPSNVLSVDYGGNLGLEWGTISEQIDCWNHLCAMQSSINLLSCSVCLKVRRFWYRTLFMIIHRPYDHRLVDQLVFFLLICTD